MVDHSGSQSAPGERIILSKPTVCGIVIIGQWYAAGYLWILQQVFAGLKWRWEMSKSLEIS
jgi:hypothetical protein